MLFGRASPECPWPNQCYSGKSPQRTPNRNMVKVSLRRAAGNYLLAFGLAIVGLWAELLLARSVNPHFIFTGFSVAIALSAFAGGRGPALFATGLAAVFSHLFLIGPGALVELPIGREALALSIFVGAWTSVALAAGSLHRRFRVWIDRSNEAELVPRQRDRFAELVVALGIAPAPSEVIEAIVQEPLHALAADSAILLSVSDDMTTATVTRALGYAREHESFTLRPDDRSAL